MSQKRQKGYLGYRVLLEFRKVVKMFILTVQLNIFCCSFLFRQMFWGSCCCSSSVLQPPAHNPRAKLFLGSCHFIQPTVPPTPTSHCTTSLSPQSGILNLNLNLTSSPFVRSEKFLLNSFFLNKLYTRAKLISLNCKCISTE